MSMGQIFIPSDQEKISQAVEGNHLFSVSMTLFLFWFFLFFFLLFLKILFLVAVCRAFSSGGKQGLLFVGMQGLLIAVAPLAVEHRL